MLEIFKAIENKILEINKFSKKVPYHSKTYRDFVELELEMLKLKGEFLKLESEMLNNYSVTDIMFGTEDNSKLH